ncbi:MAG: KEOPS complex subunit Pcc1 [Candidatus Aenigmatarchaeota archaeon]
MRATIDIGCKNPEDIIKAIEPDITATQRFNALLEAGENRLLLKVESEDITGLLTGINSYLRLIRTAIEVEKIG